MTNNPYPNTPRPDQFPGPYTPEPKNGMGIAALILGLVGLLFCLIPFTGFIGVICGFVGIVLGFVGWGRVRRHRATNKVTTLIGIVLSALAIAGGIWGIVIVFNATDDLVTDLEDIGNNSEAYGDCISNNPVEKWAELCQQR